jgi:cytochrome c biogenesis protein CcmG/thiol:disulfide interchange protein DsbE
MRSGLALGVMALCGVLAQGALLPEKDRKPAANFALEDANGKTLKLSDLKGKVVLLNFWATWCGPCKIEIPWFEDFQTTYKGQGFTVVGVSMDDDGWKAVKPYLAKAKMNYPIVIGNDKMADSFGGVDAMPTTLLIDKNGKIAGTHTGLVGKDVYQKEILELMGKK